MTIVSWGIWGFLSKWVGAKVHWAEMMTMLGVGTLLVALIAAPTSFLPKWTPVSLIALGAGVACAFGYFFFYRALIKGEASAVIPISSLYIVVSAILAIAFLHEPLTVKKVLGILSAITAIVLLS